VGHAPFLPRWRALAGLVLLLALLPRLSAAAPPPLPVLTQPVHDLANVVDAASQARLEELSRMLLAATGDVIVVVTVPTVKPDYADAREYAVKLFENHGRGIGDRQKDNGVLVLLAVQDRQVWVEVGYGLEGAITDGFAGETSRLYMRPQFQQGQYGAGLVAGVTRLLQRIAAERNVAVGDLPRLADENRQRPGAPEVQIPLWAILLLIFALYMLFRASRNSYAGGSPSMRRRRGGSAMWGGGSNWSGWGGGGSFGGGSFGGGFGGFGGGSSGGGGGGSSW
jgi:uncharacterized protein